MGGKGRSGVVVRVSRDGGCDSPSPMEGMEGMEWDGMG